MSWYDDALAAGLALTIFPSTTPLPGGTFPGSRSEGLPVVDGSKACAPLAQGAGSWGGTAASGP
jgi:hypothetical protein